MLQALGEACTILLSFQSPVPSKGTPRRFRDDSHHSNSQADVCPTNKSVHSSTDKIGHSARKLRSVSRAPNGGVYANRVRLTCDAVSDCSRRFPRAHNRQKRPFARSPAIADRWRIENLQT